MIATNALLHEAGPRGCHDGGAAGPVLLLLCRRRARPAYRLPPVFRIHPAAEPRPMETPMSRIELRRVVLLAALFFAVLCVGGCNTLRGIGLDIQGASEGIARRMAAAPREVNP